MIRFCHRNSVVFAYHHGSLVDVKVIIAVWYSAITVILALLYVLLFN